MILFCFALLLLFLIVFFLRYTVVVGESGMVGPIPVITIFIFIFIFTFGQLTLHGASP